MKKKQPQLGDKVEDKSFAEKKLILLVWKLNTQWKQP